MTNTNSQRKDGPQIEDTVANPASEIGNLEVQTSTDSAFERLNAISFSRSMRRLQTNYRLHLVAKNYDEERESKAS